MYQHRQRLLAARSITSIKLCPNQPAVTKPKMPIANLALIRHGCRRYARQFNYPSQLFDRIPIYVFHYFASPSPMDFVQGSFDPMDIMNVFMIINQISADLMAAFYAAGGQDFQTVLRIHDYLLRMWDLYRNTEPIDLHVVFGTNFSYHLASRSLRRMDMSLVTHRSGHDARTHFVPNHPGWRRAREVRRLYRSGQYVIADCYDLAEFQMAWSGGYGIRRGRSSQ